MTGPKAFAKLAADVSVPTLRSLLDLLHGTHKMALCQGKWLIENNSGTIGALDPFAFLIYHGKGKPEAFRLEYRCWLWHNTSRELRIFAAWWDTTRLEDAAAELALVIDDLLKELHGVGTR